MDEYLAVAGMAATLGILVLAAVMAALPYWWRARRWWVARHDRRSGLSMSTGLPLRGRKTRRVPMAPEKVAQGVERSLPRSDFGTIWLASSGANEKKPRKSKPATARHSRRARKIVEVAAWIGGRQQKHRRDEWLADLATGHQPTPRAHIRYARGLIWAAIRIRSQHLTAWSGRRLDWILTTNNRAATLVSFVETFAVTTIWIEQGFTEVVKTIGSLVTWGAAMALGITWLRKHRGITVRSRTPESDDNEPS